MSTKATVAPRTSPMLLLMHGSAFCMYSAFLVAHSASQLYKKFVDLQACTWPQHLFASHLATHPCMFDCLTALTVNDTYSATHPLLLIMSAYQTALLTFFCTAESRAGPYRSSLALSLPAFVLSCTSHQTCWLARTLQPLLSIS